MEDYNTQGIKYNINNININIPSIKVFIHKIYINSAEEFFKEPLLFYHNYDPETTQKNFKLIQEKIKYLKLSVLLHIYLQLLLRMEVLLG